MRCVDSPANFPGRCYVTAKDEDPRGFVDFECAFDGASLYLCHDIVVAAGREVGMLESEAVDSIIAQRDELASQVEALAGKVSELEAFKSAIHVIQSAGFKPQKKRGPKPQENK